MNANLKYYLLKQQGLSDEEAMAQAGVGPLEGGSDLPEDPADEIAADAVPQDFKSNRQPLRTPAADETPVTDENYDEKLRDPNRRIFSDAQLKGHPSTPTAAQAATGRPDAETSDDDKVLEWLKGRKAGNSAGDDMSAKVDLAIIRSRSYPSAADNMVAGEAVRSLGSGKQQAQNQQRDDVMNYIYKKQGCEDKAAQLQFERDKMNANLEEKRIESGKKDTRQEQLDARHDVERKENNAYRDQAHQDSQANAAATRAIAAASLEHREEQDAENDSQKLAKETGGDPARIQATLDRIDKAIADKSDIPGIGSVEGRLPDFATSNEGLQIRNDAKSMADALLRMQSGAGVSDRERQSMYRLYGIEGGDERSFREGLVRLREALSAELKAKQAGFKPETVEGYKARGGTTAEDVSPTGKEAAPAAPASPPAGAIPKGATNVKQLKNGKWIYTLPDGTTETWSPR